MILNLLVVRFSFKNCDPLKHGILITLSECFRKGIHFTQVSLLNGYWHPDFWHFEVTSSLLRIHLILFLRSQFIPNPRWRRLGIRGVERRGRHFRNLISSGSERFVELGLRRWWIVRFRLGNRFWRRIKSKQRRRWQWRNRICRKEHGGRKGRCRGGCVSQLSKKRSKLNVSK